MGNEGYDSKLEKYGSIIIIFSPLNNITWRTIFCKYKLLNSNTWLAIEKIDTGIMLNETR